MTTTQTSRGAILVVEDDVVNRAFLERFLGDHGYDVTAVASGEEGMRAIEQQRFALILLDLMLPGMNGGELAWAARERGVAAPIVAISAAMDIWDEADLADLGVSETLAKPYANDELLARVAALVGGA